MKITTKVVDFVMITKFDKKAYKQYAALNAAERKCLPSTNFWRMKNGLEPIPVPPEDAYYAFYFQSPEQVAYVNTNTKKKSAPKDSPAKEE